MPYPRVTHDEWLRNCEASLSYLDSITSHMNPQWIATLRSAQRVARDFDKQYYVLWCPRNPITNKPAHYHIYDPKHPATPSGNYDIVMPDGHIIH